MIEELENRFNIRYPQKTKATYTSLLNYSKDLDTSLQRWYRYKEGYSIELDTLPFHTARWAFAP